MAVNIKILGLLAASVLCWVLIVTATATADWSETNPSGSCDEKRGLWESCFEGPGCQQVTCQQIEDDDNLDAKERATRTFIILACMIGGVASACLGLMVFVEGSGCALTVVILHVVTELCVMIAWTTYTATWQDVRTREWGASYGIIVTVWVLYIPLCVVLGIFIRDK